MPVCVRMRRTASVYRLWIIFPFNSFYSRTVLECSGMLSTCYTSREKKNQVQFLASYLKHPGLLNQANTVTRIKHTLILNHTATTWFFSSILVAVESPALIVHMLWDLYVPIPHLCWFIPATVGQLTARRDVATCHHCATAIITVLV